MKILVTGGAGFIGSHIVDKLISAGHRVCVIDNLSGGKRENINKKARFYKAGIQDSSVKKIIVGIKPDYIYHCAAQIDVRKSVANPLWDAKVNILGFLHVLQAAQECGVKKIIFSSTGGAIYGDTNDIPTPETHAQNPQSPYGIGKLVCEKYLYYFYAIHKLPSIILRYANVYGPRQNAQGEAGVVAIFCRTVLQKKPLVINGDGKQTRDYVYIDDVVRANLMALRAKKFDTYNVGTGKETTVNDLVSYLKKCTSSDISFSHGRAKSGEQNRSCLDYRKIKKNFGWIPNTDIKTGIAKTFAWFKEKSQSKNGLK